MEWTALKTVADNGIYCGGQRPFLLSGLVVQS